MVRTVGRLQRSEATLGRVARAAGLSQSTAYRILRTLTEERMLYYDEERRCYHLGILAFELGLAASGKSQVQGVFQPVVEAIARRTRLTTYLMARSGDEAVCLLRGEGASAIRARPIEVGQRLPLGIGAGSLAILATCDDAEAGSVLAANAATYDIYPGGRDEIPRIRERAAECRKHGFAMSSGSVAPGICGVGVAVVPKIGLLQLAVSVSAVCDTMDRSEARKFADAIRSALQHADMRAPGITRDGQHR